VVGDVLLNPLCSIWWGYGRISGGIEGCFLIILDLSWEMAPRLDFGIMCGVGRRPLRKLLRIYTLLFV
jgi:hypothetical protein